MTTKRTSMSTSRSALKKLLMTTSSGKWYLTTPSSQLELGSSWTGVRPRISVRKRSSAVELVICDRYCVTCASTIDDGISRTRQSSSLTVITMLWPRVEELLPPLVRPITRTDVERDGSNLTMPLLSMPVASS